MILEERGCRGPMSMIYTTILVAFARSSVLWRFVIQISYLCVWLKLFPTLLKCQVFIVLAPCKIIIKLLRTTYWLPRTNSSRNIGPESSVYFNKFYSTRKHFPFLHIGYLPYFCQLRKQPTVERNATWQIRHTATKKQIASRVTTEAIENLHCTDIELISEDRFLTWAVGVSQSGYSPLFFSSFFSISSSFSSALAFIFYAFRFLFYSSDNISISKPFV